VYVILNRFIYSLLCLHVVSAPFSIYIAQRTIMVCLILWPICFWLKRDYAIERTSLNQAIISFLIISLISSVSNPLFFEIRESFRKFIPYLYLSLYFLVIHFMNSPERVRLLYRLFAASMAVFAVHIFWLRIPPILSGEHLSAIGSQTHPIIIVFGLGILFSGLGLCGNKMRAAVYGIAILLVMGCLINFKVAGYLGLAVALCSYGFMCSDSIIKKPFFVHSYYRSCRDLQPGRRPIGLYQPADAIHRIQPYGYAFAKS